MTTKEECILSMYQEVTEIDGHKGISLVKHQLDGKIYIKKELTAFHSNVYQYLKIHRMEGVPKVYEVIRAEDRLIVIEEYIHGSTLEELLKAYKFTERETVELAVNLCRILEQFHEADPPIVHRDIKPSNIMLSADGVLKLIDFNIAREVVADQSKDTRMMGTASYAAPEQFGFGQSDGRTDIYGIGRLMQELLPETDRSQKLKEIINKCTNLEPKNRYQNVGKLRAALERWMGGQISHGGLGNHDSGTLGKLEHGRMYSYALPGFRSKSWSIRLLAILGYASLIYLCSFVVITIEGKEITTPILITYRITCFIFLMFLVLLIGDYRGISKKFPLCAHRLVWVRVIGWLCYAFLALVIWVIVFMLITSVM